MQTFGSNQCNQTTAIQSLNFDAQTPAQPCLALPTPVQPCQPLTFATYGILSLYQINSSIHICADGSAAEASALKFIQRRGLHDTPLEIISKTEVRGECRILRPSFINNNTDDSCIPRCIRRHCGIAYIALRLAHVGLLHTIWKRKEPFIQWRVRSSHHVLSIHYICCLYT